MIRLASKLCGRRPDLRLCYNIEETVNRASYLGRTLMARPAPATQVSEWDTEQVMPEPPAVRLTRSAAQRAALTGGIANPEQFPTKPFETSVVAKHLPTVHHDNQSTQAVAEVASSPTDKPLSTSATVDEHLTKKQNSNQKQNKSVQGAANDISEKGKRRKIGDNKPKASKPKAKAKNAKEQDVVPDSSPADAPGCQFWLLKSEPDEFSIDDLAASDKQTAEWEGVRNREAAKYLRTMRRGDQAFFYHSSCSKTGVVGIVEIVGESVPDRSAWSEDSKYYDVKSKPNDTPWVTVDVKLVRKMARLISLAELKGVDDDIIRTMQLISRPRLSVQQVTQQQWEAVLALEHQDQTSSRST